MLAHIAAALAALVVMAAPSIWRYSGTAADIDHMVGPVAASVAIMAVSQILRGLRWLNVALGLVLLGSLPLATRGAAGSMAIGVIGTVIIVTSFVRGRLDVDFGGGWCSLWRGGEHPRA